MARTTGSIGTETAKRVLDVSQKLFAAHGYAAVSMRQIAGECGLQAGALYNHFPTKQAILRDLMVSHLEELLSAFEAELFEHKSAYEALEHFVRFHIRYHVNKPDEIFIAYMELRNLEPDPHAEVMGLRDKYESILRSILKQGKASSEFDLDDVSVTAMAMISMMSGVNTWYRDGGRLNVGEVEEIYVKMILAAVGFNPAEQKKPKLEVIA